LKKNHNVEYVFFGDPTFTANKKRIKELCSRLRKEGLDLKWECLARVDTVDEGLMREMQKSGCEAVFYGLESGSDNVLKKLKPDITVQQSLDIINLSKKYFKTIEVSLMWGFPFETLQDFKQTLRIREYLENEFCCEVQLRWLEPYPGTALFNEYKNSLFLPKETSLMYNKQAVQAGVAEGKDFYNSADAINCIRIATDVTNIRFVIAAAHIVQMCSGLIENNPEIFPDYYRYETVDLRKKINLVKKYSLY